jgi:hypothetical protein
VLSEADAPASRRLELTTPRASTAAIDGQPTSALEVAEATRLEQEWSEERADLL